MTMADGNGPWNDSGKDKPASGGGGEPQRGSPWMPPSDPGDKPKPGRSPRGLEDMLRNGPFGPNLPAGLPQGNSLWLAIGGGLVALWIAFTSVHRLDPEEEGVVTRLGSYSRTLGPGIGFSLPAPFEHVVKVPVRQIQTDDFPQGSGQNLVLTGDQNIINLAYTVRWTIKDPERYLFQLDDPRGTLRDATESAMRATMANFGLAQAIGSGRTDIEQQVQERLQAILNSYASGINIEGVAIRDSGPPTEVEEAFNNVNAAKQQSESLRNQARAYAEQVQRRAEGDAAQFDSIYAQYRLAPEVTRRRLYYETMERILTKAEKTVVDSRGVVPYMALPEARRAAPTQPAAQPAAASPATANGEASR
jgi:membrane protease subunit HflK